MFILSIIVGALSLQVFLGSGYFILNKFNSNILLTINFVLLALLILSTIFKVRYNLKIKSNELGSNTSKKLIRSFFLISFIPSILITISSLLIFNYGIEKWFNEKISSLVSNSRNIAQNYLIDHQKSIVKDMVIISNDLNRNKNLLIKDNQKFSNYLNIQSNIRDIKNLYIINNQGKLILKNTTSSKYLKPSNNFLITASNGKPLIISDAYSKKTLALIKLNSYDNLYLYTFQEVDPKIVSFLSETGIASNYYNSVKVNLKKIQITFFIIYIILTIFLILASKLFAVSFSSKITKPLSKLFKGAKKISEGNYNVFLGKDKNDDFSKLNIVFDDMAHQIKKQKQKSILSGRYEAWQVIARKLAHEIKNPLTPIQLSLDRIKNKIDDKENSLKHLNIINNQINEISNLVNSFSDFARMPKPKIEKNSLLNLVKNSIDTYKLNYPSINFILNNNNLEDEIHCDKNQIGRVLVNVYKNAVESLEEANIKNNLNNAEIITSLNESATSYIVTIEDNGIGFVEDKKNYDEPYFSTKKTGSGLGLSIVSKIIHEHNGQIFYENKTNKNGAIITITLPKINE